MKEVQNKWNTLKLNDDIWAKLIYFEQNRRLAKAYVSAPVLTIDGSANGLDGFRIGLSGIDNTYRSLSSTRCLRSIGPGVKLKIDNQGNILIRKVANNNLRQQQQQQAPNMRQCSIWVKDWPGSSMNNIASNQSSGGSLNENCFIRELEKSDVSYKLFDMRKFRLQLEKKRLKNDPNFLDWRQCVSIISFVRNNNDESHKPSSSSAPSDLLLEDPCWIMLINIIAIDMLKNSIICDRDNNLLSTRQKMGSSKLIHQHALLESTNDQNVHFFSNNEPTRTSSSASILTPASASTKTLQLKSASSKYQSYSNNSNNNNEGINLSNNNTSDSMPLDSTTRQDASSNLELVENNLMLATSDRIKKLRTANNRYRMSPSKSGSYYRKYQSTQQLSSSSGNNTIYTTFNSKFINSKQKKSTNQGNYPFSVTDNSSTSDNYNSVSRSTSSGNYWNNYQQPFYQIDHSFKQRLQLQRYNNRYRDDAKLVPGQGFLTTPFEPKSISLSTFDLSLKPLDLRTSIKMNYDDKVEENEVDIFGRQDNCKSIKATPFEDNFTEFPLQMHSRRAIVSLNNRRLKSSNENSFIEEASKKQVCYCCFDSCNDIVGDHNDEDDVGSLIKSNNDKSKHNINRKEYQSNENKPPLKLASSKCTSTQNKKNVEQTLQKTSRSSIDSSSSSSGCADNDYFISHSSSSMSSSTESNERELFSQPASSSGIACSGNTSDEYEDGCGSGSGSRSGEGQKHQQIVETCAKTSHICTRDHICRSLSSKNVSVYDLTKKKMALKQSEDIGDSIKMNNDIKYQNKRGSRNKSLGINSASCCDSGLIDQAHDHDINSTPKEFDCDCPSIEVGCNCCCDCFVDRQLKTAKPLASSSSSSKSAFYEDESIYSRLPCPTDISQTTTNESKSNSTNSNNNNNNNKTNETQRNENTVARVSSTNNLNKVEYKDEENISTIPNVVSNSKKASKQSNSGWLEKRRYSKILPKFMFSSSSSSSSSSANSNRQVRNSDKNTQRKSSTLDRGEKFTPLKSTYEL